MTRSASHLILAGAALAAVIAGTGFLIAHFILILRSGFDLPEVGVMALLIGCELFMVFHGCVYFLNVARVAAAASTAQTQSCAVALLRHPVVVFAMCSYREPLDVIEANMLCFRALTYPNKLLYLLDDTPYGQEPTGELLAYRQSVEELCQRYGINLFRHRWREAKAGLINDFLRCLEGRMEPGFEESRFQRNYVAGVAVYLALFDIDMNPLPDFADHLVAELEADPGLAFVQTPQFYSNTATSRVAAGAAFQQAIFYEYICEGKGLQGAMPCCGTNVMFRISALRQIGGVDETSVTEDFATSIRLHLAGWRSIYVNRVSAFGMGPRDLPAFFRQQYRWATGTVGLLRYVLSEFLRRPRAMSLMKWAECLASVSYYCVGWIWLVVWLLPVVYIFFDFPRSLASPAVFFALFVPYVVLTFWVFFAAFQCRGYSIGDILKGLTMNVISFPVYLRASAMALLGVKGKFRVTPKVGTSSVPLFKLWPQLAAFLIAVLTLTWGLNHIFYGTRSLAAVLGALIWCIYNGAMIGMILYFNSPHDSADPNPSPTRTDSL